MWHRFSRDLQQTMISAAEQAMMAGEKHLTTRHLLESLAADHSTLADQTLTELGVTPEALHHALCETAMQEGQDNPMEDTELTLTREARIVTEQAGQIAVDLGDSYLEREHLLLALIQGPEGSAASRVLTQLGVTWPKAGRSLMAKKPRWTKPLPGIPVPGIPVRKTMGHVRKGGRTVKRLLFGLIHFREPFMPYLVFWNRIRNYPYPFYTRLRRTPLYWDGTLHQWYATGYQDVGAVLSEPQFSNQMYKLYPWEGKDLPPVIVRELRQLQGSTGRQMLFLDAPDQSRQRSLVARQFTPRIIARMRAQIQQTTDAILDALAPSGRMEVISEFALPMPLGIISRMLGVPDADAAEFKQWSEEYICFIAGETSLSEDLTAHRSLRRLTAYFQALIQQRQEEPQDDLITLLLQANDQGEKLTEQEVVDNCLLLLVAGHENTTRLIGNGLWALLKHPEQMQKLRDDPALLGPAVDEMLRYDSPVQWTSRVVAKTFEWRGRTFEKDQIVRVGLAAANRDPSQFPNPDRFDITRTENRHFALGNGPHFCLGAALTRLEGQIAIGTLLARFPKMRLEKPPKQSLANFGFRGLASLHIRWD